MKKLLVLALSAIMVIAMATVSMAAITMSGEVNMKYDFAAYNEKDQLDGKINFESKLNDEVTAYVSFQWDSDCAVAGNATGVKAGDRAVMGVYANEAYIAMKKSFGTFKFGEYEVKPYGSQIYDSDSTYAAKMKAPFTFGYALPKEWLPEGFKAGFDYFRDNNDAVKDMQARTLQGAGSYVVNFGYANKLFGLDYWRVDYGDPASAAIYSTDFSNAFYGWVKPIDLVRVKASASENGGDFRRMLGFDFYIPGMEQLTLTYEKYWWDGMAQLEEPYGYIIGWTLKNGVYFDYRARDNKDNTDLSQEFRVKLKFK